MLQDSLYIVTEITQHSEVDERHDLKNSVCNGRLVGNVEIRTDLPTLCCGLNVKFAVIFIV